MELYSFEARTCRLRAGGADGKSALNAGVRVDWVRPGYALRNSGNAICNARSRQHGLKREAALRSADWPCHLGWQRGCTGGLGAVISPRSGLMPLGSEAVEKLLPLIATGGVAEINPVSADDG